MMTRTYLLAGGRRARAHPAADAFPLLTEDELSALAADILEHGQRVPVLLQRGEDGVDVVVDGRNRLLACEAGGVEPEVAYVEPTADAVPVIVSLNWARRHQGESQRAMAAARLVNLVRGRPGQTASTTIDAVSQGRAAGLLHLGRATVQRAAAIVDDPILAPAVDAEQVSVSDAYAIRHAADEAKQRALAAVADGSARTLRGALGRAAAEPATGGLGSTEPAAELATGRSEPRRDAADTGAVMASPDAPAALDGGSGSASELVEPSTAGATDAEAHRAAEPGGTAAADPAGGGAASDSASSRGGVSGDTTSAVRDRELGGAGASPAPARSLPAPLAASTREAAESHGPGVEVATAEQTTGDAGPEPRNSSSGSTDSGAADPAGGGAASDSASSRGGVSGDTTSAVRDRELGGAGASPAPARSLPAPLAASTREAAESHGPGVEVATAGQIAGDAGPEPRSSTSGSTDSGAADPAGGPAASGSTSSGGSMSGGGAVAVRGREWAQQPAGRASGVGGADVSLDSTPLLPAAAVAERESADARGEGVHATAGRNAGDADGEFRRRLAELGSAAARLGAVSRVGPPSGFEATCALVRALVSAMERCLEVGLDEQAMLAGLPADLIHRLDAHLSNKTVIAASTQKRGDADGRGRGSALFGQAGNPRAWVKKRFGI